jgi:hypothetical protein
LATKSKLTSVTGHGPNLIPFNLNSYKLPLQNSSHTQYYAPFSNSDSVLIPRPPKPSHMS